MISYPHYALNSNTRKSSPGFAGEEKTLLKAAEDCLDSRTQLFMLRFWQLMKELSWPQAINTVEHMIQMNIKACIKICKKIHPIKVNMLISSIIKVMPNGT